MKKRTFPEKEQAGIMTMIRGGASEDEPALLIDFQPVEIEFDVEFDFDFSALPSLPSTPGTSLARAPCTGTRKISIRVSNAVLNAFRDQAKRKGTKPQTLINRVLKEQSKGW